MQDENRLLCSNRPENSETKDHIGPWEIGPEPQSWQSGCVLVHRSSQNAQGDASGAIRGFLYSFLCFPKSSKSLAFLCIAAITNLLESGAPSPTPCPWCWGEEGVLLEAYLPLGFSGAESSAVETLFPIIPLERAETRLASTEKEA